MNHWTLLLSAVLALASSSTATASLRGFGPKPLPPFPTTFEGQGFTIMANLNFDATLPGNEKVIGVHLHTGSSTVNGPIGILFCGSAPLPAVNGPCQLTNAKNVTGGRFEATFVASSSAGAWTNGIANATAVKGATSIEAGAATTPLSFYDTLANSTTTSSNVYLNFHTAYSLSHNDGMPFGLARAQLKPVLCSENVPTNSRCYGAIGGTVSSSNTNLVHGLPTQFPANAGSATAVRRDLFFDDILVVYTPTSSA